MTVARASSARESLRPRLATLQSSGENAGDIRYNTTSVETLSMANPALPCRLRHGPGDCSHLPPSDAGQRHQRGIHLPAGDSLCFRLLGPLRFHFHVARWPPSAFNYYFLPPVGTFTIADPQNWVALTAFLVTAITASRLSEQARRRARDANRRRQEIERLYAFTQQMLVAGGVVELLNAIPRHIVESFEVQDAALYLANRDAVYRSGRDFRELDDDQLKAVMARGEAGSRSGPASVLCAGADGGAAGGEPWAFRRGSGA